MPRQRDIFSQSAKQLRRPETLAVVSANNQYCFESDAEADRPDRFYASNARKTDWTGSVKTVVEQTGWTGNVKAVVEQTGWTGSAKAVVEQTDLTGSVKAVVEQVGQVV